MNKKFLIIIIVLFTSSSYAQDSLGIKFQFGYQKGQVYNYKVVNQEFVRNVNDGLLSYVIDSFYAQFEIETASKSGYTAKVTFKPSSNQEVLPDLYYNVPLKLRLDSVGNAIGMTNHMEYRAYLYAGIDELVKNGVHDSLTAYQLKYQYRTNSSIENLVYHNFSEFFTLFSRQFRVDIEYFVGKPIYHPFSSEPFLAGGKTVVKRQINNNSVLEVKTEIGNTKEERVILIQEYDNYLKRYGTYNPNVLSPPVDVFYNSVFKYDTNLNIVKHFYLEEVLRFGDQSKFVTSKMELVN